MGADILEKWGVGHKGGISRETAIESYIFRA